MTLSLGDYVGPNSTRTLDSEPLQKIIEGIYSICDRASNDVTSMYTLVYDTVTITLPTLGSNITHTALLIVQAIEAIPDCPIAATFALLNAKDQIQGYIGTALYLQAQFEDVFFISSGELPPWLQPTNTVLTIVSELMSYLLYNAEVLNWGCNTTQPSNPTACVVNRSTYDAEVSVTDQLSGMRPIQDIFRFIDTAIVQPINRVSQLYLDLTTAWDNMIVA